MTDSQPPVTACEPVPREISGVAAAYMNAHGPGRNPDCQAAEQLLDAAWGIPADVFGPLVGYDRNRGGFAWSNIAGLGASWDKVSASWKQDRGDDSLGQAIQIADTLTKVAEGISTISGAIGTACAIGSLIGLIPPLAPVGGVLASVAGVCNQVTMVASIVALAGSTITSVLSAIRLVRAVESGSSNLAEIYTQYQEDVSGIMTNGISIGLSLLFSKSKSHRAKNADSGLKMYSGAIQAADGRAARGIANRGLNTMRKNPINLMNVKGMTRENLTGRLRREVLLGKTEDLANGFAASAVNNVLPLPEHSVHELDQICTSRQEIGGARARQQGVREEGEGAIRGAELLQSQAIEYETLMCSVDEDQATVRGELAEQSRAIEEGRTQSTQGQEMLSNSQAQTAPCEAQVRSSSDELNSTEMPETPEDGGLLDRIAGWFQDRVFGVVSRALAKVQQFVADLILKIVAGVMGIDDIHARLAEVKAGMDTAAESNAQTEAQAQAVDGQAASGHQQAAQAAADAQQAGSIGQQSIEHSNQMDAQLAAQDQALAVREQEIATYCTEYADENEDLLELLPEEDIPASDSSPKLEMSPPARSAPQPGDPAASSPAAPSTANPPGAIDAPAAGPTPNHTGASKEPERNSTPGPQTQPSPEPAAETAESTAQPAERQDEESEGAAPDAEETGHEQRL